VQVLLTASCRWLHRNTAEYIIDNYILDGQIVGLGTGLAVNALIEALSQRLTSGSLKSIKCVPSSDVSASEAAFHGVPLVSLHDVEYCVDLVVDVADEVDIGPAGGLAYIVGRGANGQQAGQPSLPRLRDLLRAADRSVIVAETEDSVSLLVFALLDQVALFSSV